MRARRFAITLVSAVYFGALVGLTFVPGSAANRSFWAWPFAAFVPVGILLVLILGRRRWWAALAFAVLGSAWVEAAQTVWMPVGYAEAVDVLWSSGGALLGVAIAWLATAHRRDSMRTHESHRMVAQSGGREIPQD